VKQKSLAIIIGLFAVAVVFLLAVILLKSIGSRYSSGLSALLPNTVDAPPELQDKRRLRKITIEQEDGCIEVSSEGVVRQYTECGGTLVDTNRLFDPKRIIELFEYTSRLDPEKYKTPPLSVPYIRLVVESDTGTQVLYVPVGSGPDSISDTVKLIIGDLPQPTQTPAATLIPTPTLPGTTPLPTLQPSPTIPFGLTPTPTFVPQNTPRPFTCGYTVDGSDKRPYNVTNVICSTQPTPGQ
jgi:hypothetical protein